MIFALECIKHVALWQFMKLKTTFLISPHSCQVNTTVLNISMSIRSRHVPGEYSQKWPLGWHYSLLKSGWVCRKSNVSETDKFHDEFLFKTCQVCKQGNVLKTDDLLLCYWCCKYIVVTGDWKLNVRHMKHFVNNTLLSINTVWSSKGIGPLWVQI